MKKIAVIMLACSLLLCAACQPGDVTGTGTPGTDVSATPTQSGESWEGKYANVNGARAEISVSADSTDASAKNVTFTLAPEKEGTITLASPVSEEFNYYTLSFSSTQPLWMYVGYTKDGAVYEELCFLEAGENSTFKSFVDGYMNSNTASGLVSLRFSNRGKENAKVEISALNTSKRDNIEKEIYLQNDYIKIGADLVFGGGLSYLEYIKEPVSMVTRNGRAEIVLGETADPVVTDHVNMFNNHDTGRLVQQSYYGSNLPPYECGEFSGMKWNYNPVMGGDQHGNSSKIIDFELTENHIYVKCRPMDWAKDNEPTLSYMESTYTVSGRVLSVQNRFVDFSPYKHVKANQELPALYVIEPLKRLAYYEGKEAWTDGELTYKDNLPFWNGIWPTFKSPENWWAWVNGDDNGFGIGLYVQGVGYVTGGIFNEGKDVGTDPSKGNPTSYIAPLRQMKLVNFEPLEYSYAISCGRLNEIRESFKEINSAGKLDNSALRSYGRKK